MKSVKAPHSYRHDFMKWVRKSRGNEMQNAHIIYLYQQQ